MWFRRTQFAGTNLNGDFIDNKTQSLLEVAQQNEEMFEGKQLNLNCNLGPNPPAQLLNHLEAAHEKPCSDHSQGD